MCKKNNNNLFLVQQRTSLAIHITAFSLLLTTFVWLQHSCAFDYSSLLHFRCRNSLCFLFFSFFFFLLFATFSFISYFCSVLLWSLNNLFYTLYKQRIFARTRKKPNVSRHIFFLKFYFVGFPFLLMLFMHLEFL